MQMFSAPADRNKQPLFDLLADLLRDLSTVLEIGSGTGQHALHFAENMPHLTWVPSDVADALVVLQAQCKANPRENICSPQELDVSALPWNIEALDSPVDMVYTTNTLHIMSWESVEDFFTGVGQVLTETGYLVVYGPFKYAGEFTTPSNADFDLWLKARDPESGVRDFEAVNQLAKSVDLELQKDHAMPANNQCLIWRRCQSRVNT